MNTDFFHLRRKSFRLQRILLLAAVGLSIRCGAPEPEKQSTAASTATATPSVNPEAAGAARVDVCGLLTSAEIEQALGKRPGEAKAGTEGLGECAWPSADDPSPLLTLKLSANNLASYDAFVSRYQTEFGGEEPSPEYYHRVEGLGTWAMYVVDDGALRIYRGDRLLEVAPKPADEAKAVALGKMAATRLN
ncbi:MAG TPA: DUF3558 family protein [Vicinamibacteria bacterium]|jgi:hypothetical protein